MAIAEWGSHLAALLVLGVKAAETIVGRSSGRRMSHLETAVVNLGLLTQCCLAFYFVKVGILNPHEAEPRQARGDYHRTNNPNDGRRIVNVQESKNLD